MTAGTWETTSVVKKSTVIAAVVLVAAFAVLGALLWPVLVVLGNIAWIVLTHVWAALPSVVCFELVVVFSAFLDWHEARAAIRSWRHGWMLAHVTVWRRLWRRRGWVWSLAVAVRKQYAKPTDPPAESSAVPVFAGVVIEHDAPTRKAA